MKTTTSKTARRAVTAALAVVTAGALLAGCAGSDGESSDDGAGRVTWATDAAWHKAGQEALDESAQAAIGIGIESEIYPSTDAFQADIRSSVTTSSAPGLFDWWSGYRLQDLADQDLLVDLSDSWDAAIDAGEYPADLKEMFSWDGKAYGLPKLVNYWGVAYNTAVFEEHGLEVPTTWDEMLAVCATLSDAGVTPFGFVIQDMSWASFIWFEQVLVGTDPDLYTGVLDGSIAYDDPRVIEAVGTWTGLIEDGYITPSAQLNNDNYIQEFQNGSYGMYLMGDWVLSSFDSAGLEGGTDYGFFAMPGITEQGDRSLIVEARPTVIPKASGEVTDAEEFADYFLSTEGATVWAEAAGVNSPNLKAPESSRPAALREISQQVSNGDFDLYPRYWEGTPTPVVDAVYPLLGKIVEHPEDAANILKEAQTAAQAAWPRG